MHCLHTSNTTLFNLDTTYFSHVWLTPTTFALLLHAEATQQQKAWSNERALELPSLFTKELSDCQVMKENSSEQCSLDHKGKNYTNLILNKMYLRGITSFCGTKICSFHFSHAEVHQKRARIARLVLLTWHFGQLLTLLWDPGEQPHSPLQPQLSQTSSRLSAY